MSNAEKIPIEEEVPFHPIPNGEPEKSKQAADDELEDVLYNKAQLEILTSAPLWVGTRWTFFVVFWIAFIGMLISVIIIIVVTPRCPTVAWYESTVIYQIYPKTFQDSNSSGIGDFMGILSRLDHVEKAGAKILSLGSIFDSDMDSKSLDVIDFNKLDSSLGTNEEFQQLLGKAWEKEMKICIDFIPNHTSDKHYWFEESRHNKTNSYHNYYVWADGSGINPSTNPPNNWLSVTGGSAWSYEPLRQQWYLHTFGQEKPDLNYRSDDLKADIKASLEYWLGNGIDGVFFKDVSYLYESEDLEDEQVNPDWSGSAEDYNSLLHTKTFNQPENNQLLNEWKAVLSDFSYLGKYRLFTIDVAESSNSSGVITVNSDLTFTSFLIDGLEEPLSGTKVNNMVEEWLSAKEASGNSNRWDVLSLGSAEHSRVASRLGEEYVLALNALVQTLPGTPLLYYGEEIGMTDLSQDSLSPGGEENAWRSPMQWANATNAEFSGGNSNQLYISVNSNYPEINVEDQSQDEYSVFRRYNELALLCQMPSLMAGKWTPALVNDNLYSFTMQYPDWPGYLVIINLGGSIFTGNFHSEAGMPATGRLVYSTIKRNDMGIVDLDKFSVANLEAVVIEYG